MPRKPAKKPEKPRAPRKAVFVTLTDDDDAGLNSFITAQPVEPDRAAVALKALRFFLAHHGHWPPKPRG